MDSIVKWAHENPFFAFIIILCLGSGLYTIVLKMIATVRDVAVSNIRKADKGGGCCDHHHDDHAH
jgi:hypothetical protein